MANKTSSEPVEVLATGLVCCLGRGTRTVFENMCGGACGIRPITRFPSAEYPQKRAGQLPEQVEAALRAEYPEEDLATAMVQAAARECLGQSGYQAGAADPGLGLVLATNFGPMEALEWCWRERLDLGTLDTETFAGFADCLATLASALGCGGPRSQISLSCASGTGAIALGCDWIRAGLAERVLAVGYDVLTEYCWAGLTNLRTITTDSVRPFDRRRSGTIFSEGAAAVLLAAPTGAGRQSRPAPVALVAGAATNNNAFHMTAPPREADGSRRVMAAALADACLAPSDIDHVSAHGTGTTANDSTEAAALRNLFGPHLDGMTVAAHKSQFGHMMGAAGAAEAIMTVEVLRNQIVPPTINHEETDPECRLDCVPGKARRLTGARCAMVNSAGIGGNNSALVLTTP